MTPTAKSLYAGYRFLPEIISHAVWLYFRFPLSLRMVEEMLAARGIVVSHETVRQWGRKFGQDFPSREFASADTTARAADEAVQVSGSGPTLSRRARSNQQLVPPPPRSPPCRPIPSRPDPSLSDLGRGHRRGRSGIGLRCDRPSCALSRPEPIKLTAPGGALGGLADRLGIRH